MRKELARLQAKEYESAAQEAAKDLDVDYGEQDREAQRLRDAAEEGTEGNQDSSLSDAMAKQTSFSSVLKRGSIESLANTATGLDSLIGASTAQEVLKGGDDIEQLRRYSEKIAMEADESAKSAAQEVHTPAAKAEPSIGEDEVANARAMAAQMQAQLKQGVEAAENLKKQRDEELKKRRSTGTGFSSMFSQFSFLNPKTKQKPAKTYPDKSLVFVD